MEPDQKNIKKKKIKKELCIYKDLTRQPFLANLIKDVKKKNQYLAHMTKTLVICKKYIYYKIKFAHYYV